MDWKYKHFHEQAVFNAPIQTVLEAARTAVSEAFGQAQDTPDGFVANGRSGWRDATATFHAASVASGTQLSVELVVERSTMRGYMLWDVGGYYNVQIDKWFARIAERLSSAGEQPLVSKSTLNYRVRQGCLAGCMVWLVAVLCLSTIGTVLDRAVYPQSSQSSFGGPFTAAASALALLVGIAAYLLVADPKGPVARFIRARFGRSQDQGRP